MLQVTEDALLDVDIWMLKHKRASMRPDAVAPVRGLQHTLLEAKYLLDKTVCLTLRARFLLLQATNYWLSARAAAPCCGCLHCCACGSSLQMGPRFLYEPYKHGINQTADQRQENLSARTCRHILDGI